MGDLDKEAIASGPQPSEERFRTTEGLFTLLRLPRVGHKSALTAAIRGSARTTDAALLEARASWDTLLTQTRRLISSHERGGVETIGFFDPRFPPSLRALEDPPAVIWVRGNVEALSRRAVAVIGTREPTQFGLDAASAVAAEASARSWSVVSGLAKGVDAIAHSRTLERGGTTIAVLAGGLDRVYPAMNQQLAEDIVDSGGALLAECPPGSRPAKGAFVDRDRLQSALGLAIFVCQTGRSGGSLHTVRFGVKQGKIIFCPFPIDQAPQSEGLRLLVERPGRELPSLLKQWAGDPSLKAHLTDRPTARAFDGEAGIREAFDSIEALEDSRPARELVTLATSDADTIEQLSLLA